MRFSLLATVFSGYALEEFKAGIKKSYYRFWLIHPIRTVAEAKVSDWCREGVEVEKVAQIKVLEKYETPRWVTWLSAIPVKESWFDYAYDIYKTIQLDMDELMKKLDELNQYAAIGQQQAAWRALEQNLMFVLGAKVANIEVTEQDIFKNLKAALKIVDDVITALPTLTIAQLQSAASLSRPKSDIKTPNIPAYKEVENVKQEQQLLDVKKEALKREAQNVHNRLSMLIGFDDCGKERLAKKRLSWIERYHRNKQAQWLADYVNNVCRACAIQ